VASMLVFAGDASPSTLSGRVARGELARLTRGVYTTQTADPTAVVRAEWRVIVGHLLPGAVITDRSAALAGPVDGVLYLTRPARTRDVTLPGLTVRTRPGIGPVDGDILLPGGVYQASVARGLVDNLLPSRSTHGRPGRTFDRRELGDWIDRLARVYGTRRLLEFRSEAEQLAPTLEVEPTRVRQLSDLIGAAVGTRTVAGVDSPALAARQAGLPYDGDRVARLELLADALRVSAPQNRPADPSAPRWLHLPFFEAYFSNYIEGTEFPLDVAERVVYQGEVPPARPADAHDLTGTYEIVNDLAEMSAVASDATQFLEILGHRHQVVMAGRPETQPGQFKLDANRAGATEFVAPTLVEGTLRTGFDRLASLDTAWERSVYTMFLVSEVHPFNDGNGRIARIMMNAELVAGGQARMIIPTVFRDDYLGALRRLTRSDDPSILIKALRFTHDYTANIDFSSVRVATEQLSDTNAFDDPDGQARLRQPAATPAIASRRTLPPEPR
jgi:Fic/DOC family